MTKTINLDFRPDTYFDLTTEEGQLLRKVKSVVLRTEIQTLFREGRHAAVDDLLKAFHPMYMGGNYLPDLEEDEVVIARVLLESVTRDVTSVFARRDKGGICYRLVDEYESDWPEIQSDKTLTLGELIDYFFENWPILPHLKDCYGDDLARCLDFISGESDFYSEFDEVCRQRVTEALTSP
jgi:hypothetical protein